MLIITGVGRCGTSALAGLFHRLGYPIGGGWDNKIQGGYEHEDLVEVNDKILSGSNVSDEEILSINVEFAKDPRFSQKRVLERWLTVRQDLKFIVCYRRACCSRHTETFRAV